MSEQLIDLTKTPSWLFNNAVDPAKAWPGAPTNFGEQVIPHIFTVAGQAGLAGRAYLNSDEAVRHDRANAERMRVDCGIMECLEARQRASALLNWHLEPEVETPEAKALAAVMTRILARTPRFLELRRCALEAIWYGRYAVALQYGNREIAGGRYIAPVRWEPRHGDKLVFRFDDGTARFDPDQVGIRIGVVGQHDTRALGLNREQIAYTDQGMVYWLNQWERKTLIVHKHTVEDGTYEDPYTAGKIHGVGVRSRIYWTWYAMVNCLQRALEYLDRSAFGVEIWRYPANNPAAKRKTEEAAKQQVSGGRAVVLVPMYPGDQQDLYGVEHIEPGLQGFDRLLTVIKEYFGHKVKRYILGQTLTSESDATGLGSGVADAHLATFADIVSYDSRNLEETLTEDLVRPLQLFNFRGSQGIFLRFVIDTEAPNIQEKMQALKSAWDMGAQLKASDVLDTIGCSMPQNGDERLFNPQVVGGILQMVQPQGQPVQPALQPTTPDQLAQMIAQAISQKGMLSLAE